MKADWIFALVALAIVALTVGVVFYFLKRGGGATYGDAASAAAGQASGRAVDNLFGLVGGLLKSGPPVAASPGG